MQDYAIISLAGKQYKVSPGDKIFSARLALPVGSNLTLEPLLSQIRGKTTIGTPVISEVKVIAKILDHTKGDKLRVSKYKAKSRYRKTTGFRPQLTVLEIESITNHPSREKLESVPQKKTPKKAPKE